MADKIRNNTFLIKRSNVPGKVPAAGSVLLGELALNTSDAILYTSGTTANTILPIGWDRVSRTGDTMTGGLFTPFLTATTISATTYQNLPAFTGDYLPLSGGTVYGPTIYTSGLTANTLNVTGLTQTSGITSTGGIIFKQVTINSTYSATTSDYMIDVTGGTFTVYLPSAIGQRGRILIVKNNGGGAVTVTPYNSEKIDGKPFVILGETNSIQLISNGDEWAAISYNISTVNSSTGVFEFTGLSKVTNTTFNVGEVKGWIVDDTTNPLNPQLYYIYYSGGVHTDNYATSAFETFVYLTSGSTIGQQSTPLTATQRRQNIFLGKLGHPEKTSINLVFSQPDFVLSPLAQLRDMFTPINLINGGVYPSANTGLTINTSAGYVYGLGINFASDTLSPNSLYVSGRTPCTFQYRTQTGGSVTNTTSIDPLNYDLNGVITPLSGTKATNQRIYVLQNGTFRIQYGQHEYNNFADAIQALQTETFTPFPNFVNNAVLIGILTVLSTATDLTDTSKARFFFTSKFGETIGAAGGVSTTTLQQAYNNSTTPEITTNSTLGALSIKNGTGNADNVTRLFEGVNAAGNATSFIRADGDISGTTIQTNGFTANTTGVSATTVSATTLVTSSFRANNSGMSATTVSATTYYNLPIDIRVTGGTYSNGTTTFTNNTGGTFSVTGFTTGITTSNYVVQGKLAADQTISSGADNLISFVDDFDPQNWWDPTSKRFTPNVAGYYIIAAGAWFSDPGSTASQMNLQGRFNGNTFAIAQEPNNSFGTGQNLGFTKIVYFNGSTDYADFTVYQSTGVNRTLQQGANGSGTWFSAALISSNPNSGGGGSSTFTGGTISGPTNFTAGLTANTISTTSISATTYYNLPIDVYTTGGTYSSGTATFTNNTGGTFSVTGFSTSTATTFTGGTVTGETNFTGGLTANTISATTYSNLPTDIRVTGSTYSNNTFTYTNNTGGTFNVLFNTVTGLTVNGNLTVTGNTNVRAITGTSATISGSGQNILTVIGSGTTSPLFTVQGSSGELFSVTDSLTGSLFSVNDISGLPIVEVFSDNTILMGNYLAPALNTTAKISLTAGTNSIYSIPTSAYTGAFVDYTVINSGNTSARAGNIMTIWNSGSTEYTEVSTNDIGSTTGITFSTALVGSNAVISASATTTGWTLKTIIRAI